jgi:hypothetical protein
VRCRRVGLSERSAEVGPVFFADVTIVIRYHPVGAVTVVGGWARSDSGTTVQVSVPLAAPDTPG